MTTPNLVTDVRRTLRAQLLTVPGLPAKRQWQGTTSEGGETFPPTDITQPWMRETLLLPPGHGNRKTIGQNAHIVDFGSYQISLFYPPDDEADVGPIETMGAAIKNAFPDTFEVIINAQRLTCLGTGLGTTTTDEIPGVVWLHLPVRVSWQVDWFNAN